MPSAACRDAVAGGLALALSGVGAWSAPIQPSPPFEFRADPPFHLMLIEAPSEAPLIMARVGDPTW